MRVQCTSTSAVALAVIAVLTGAACAAVPIQMNYQVMLTSDDGEPLADQSVELLFRLYDQEVGGGLLWSEAHVEMTNSIGVVSVVLGTATPMELDFTIPLWLQVEVGGEIMEPRRPLSSAPYAIFSGGAGVAEHAINSDHLGEIPSEAYALDDDLWQPGVLNDPSNPLEWTKLKNVPGGFADGVDDAGSGDGHSLDASDGDPANVVYVDAIGRVAVNTGWYEGAISVDAEQGRMGAYFRADTDGPFDVGALAVSDSSSGLVGNAGGEIYTYGVMTEPVAVTGLGDGDADGGNFAGLGTGRGVFCTSLISGDALHAVAGGTGYSGLFEGGDGVRAEMMDDYPVLDVENYRAGDEWGDAAHFGTASGASSATWSLYSDCYEGRAGYFVKRDDTDTVYAVTIENETDTSQGLYVKGTITSTAPLARTVETSRGREAVLGVTSPDLEVIASGKGRLSDGSARIDFDRLFAESISGPEHLRVTATPLGGWSAMYVERVDASGFDLRSDAGNASVEFYWVAVGRAADGERRPEITIPDEAAEREMYRRKMEEIESKRPERRERPQVVTRTLR